MTIITLALIMMNVTPMYTTVMQMVTVTIFKEAITVLATLDLDSMQTTELVMVIKLFINIRV